MIAVRITTVTVNDIFFFGKEFVVIGTEMDSEKVEAALQRCLLTDEEMTMGQRAWEVMDDPFKGSWEGGEEDGHGHGHGHAHH